MIEVKGLTKYYGELAAVHDLEFSIDRGEVIGFLGLNGAGKTTALKILGCILLHTAGDVTVDGIDIARDPHAVRRRIGFLPDTPPLYNDMTVGRYLKFAAELRGVPSSEADKAVTEAEEKTSTREVHDQPTSGLDPVQIVEMRATIRALRGEHTVLLSSHILSEISQTCDRLLVIQRGEIVAQGSEQQLATQLGGGGTIEIEVAGDAARAIAAAKTVTGIGECTVVRDTGGVALLSL